MADRAALAGWLHAVAVDEAPAVVAIAMSRGDPVVGEDDCREALIQAAHRLGMQSAAGAALACRKDQ